MISPVVYALVAFISAMLRPRASRHLEHLALWHQLAVDQHTIHRPRLCPADRLFWAWLSRFWSGWHDALVFVQPRTVLAWQQRRFREHWKRLSQRQQPGRPAIAKEVMNLIRDMSRANPTWGSPRITGELRKLGIEVANATVET
jgi:putative transposase